MTRIVVNQKLCKGCGLCVEICSKHVLELTRELNNKGYPLAFPAAIDACVACHQCEYVCPELCIDVVEDDEEEEEKKHKAPTRELGPDARQASPTNA